MDRNTLHQWSAWREDYRCQRPPVECRGCGRHYAKDENAAVMTFSGFNLIHCSNCPKPEADTTQPSEPKAPREIDLTESMPCIVSVKVTEEMILNGEIPF